MWCRCGEEDFRVVKIPSHYWSEAVTGHMDNNTARTMHISTLTTCSENATSHRSVAELSMALAVQCCHLAT
ncbi:hypothetical protein E2C01_019138 [Portunus trituberculatus]|uniref:Uncharacterized protein n=1 Tax=Portunus trituberculatus TaxID=210409 RepID=A0A5B7DWH4_PORTR|nr:hypothetical protein [Portunus trituberculatus]